MRTAALILLTLFSLNSCDTPEEDFINYYDYQRLEGDYLLVKSEADVPVDVNHDGWSSYNLFNEYLEHNKLKAGILISESDVFNVPRQFGTPTMFLEIWWNEQNINEFYDPGDMEYFSPHSTVRQPSIWNFVIDRDFTGLTLEDNPEQHPFFWTKPEKVYFEKPGRLIIITQKPLFLPEGWRTVQITNTYLFDPNSR